MKPRLILFKREVGRLDYPKTEVHFVVVDSDLSKEYPLNFVCVLPLSQTLHSGRSAFRKLFGEESVPLAKKLLSKALSKESDSEIKTEIGRRLQHLKRNNVSFVFLNKKKGRKNTSYKLMSMSTAEC